MPSTKKQSPPSAQHLEPNKEDDWEEWMDWSQDAPPPDASAPLRIDNHSNLPSSSLATNNTPNRSKEVVLEKANIPNADSKPTTSDTKPPPPSTTDRSHSLVEKRYRENLNQKIAELGDCIPALRTSTSTSDPDGGGGVGLGAGAGAGAGSAGGPQKRMNKAKVLTEAMAYIRSLETRNAHLEECNAGLKREMMGRQQQQQQRRRRRRPRPQPERSASSKSSSLSDTNPTPTPTLQQDESAPLQAQARETASKEEEETREEGDRAEGEPRGMIPIPEAMRRLWRRGERGQAHYADEVREGEGFDDF